jgi:hypothetical protein
MLINQTISSELVYGKTLIFSPFSARALHFLTPSFETTSWFQIAGTRTNELFVGIASPVNFLPPALSKKY